MKEYILCAAIWFNDGIIYEHQPIDIKTGLVICGRRHHNCYATAYTLNKKYIYKYHEANNRAIQGFITSKDRFVCREEAGQIAFDAKQIGKPTECLFSEDLY